MCRRRGMGGQALGVAQVVGDVDQRQRVQESERAIAPALELERYDGAAVAHLGHRQLRLGMARKRRIEDPRDPPVPAQVLGDRQRVCRVARQAQLERLQALEHDPGVERARRRPRVTQEGRQLVGDEGLVAGEDRAAEGPALAVHVLGGGVDDHVCAVLHGPLQDRGREDVVDDELGAGRMGKLGHRPQIDDLQRRVRRGLEKDAVRPLAPQRLLPGIQIGAVDELAFDAEARKKLGDHVVARAEQRARRNDPIAGVQLAREACEHRRHAARSGAAELRPFEQRKPILQHGDGGVGVARIDVDVGLALEGGFRLFGGFVNIARRHEETLASLGEVRALRASAHEPRGRPPRAYRFCGRVHRFFLSAGRPEQRKPRPLVPGLVKLQPFSGLFFVAASRSGKSPLGADCPRQRSARQGQSLAPVANTRYDRSM